MKLEIQKYLENSSIHGLAYTSKRYHIVERIFWSITLFASITCTLTLIIQLGIGMKNFPIVGYLSDSAVSVSEINFPAVTFCPDFLPQLPKKYNIYLSPKKPFRFEKHSIDKYYYEFPEYLVETIEERKFNLTYLELLNKFDSGELHINDLGSKILKRLQVVDTILNLGVFAKTNLTFPQDDFLDVFNEFEKAIVELNPRLCLYFSHEHDSFISEVLTPLGLCYSFNIALSSDLLNFNLTADYFHYDKALTCSSSKRNILEVPVIPRNETPYPTGLLLNWKYTFVDSWYKKNLTGHNIYLHDPYELPSSSSKKIKINSNRDGYIRIVPQIFQIDESLVNYDPKDRNCYLDTERKLKFFKKYTKANCLQECLTDFMIRRCGCVDFFMIRNSATRICSENEKTCSEIANNDFKDDEQSCRCLQPCNYVKYQFESIEKVLLPKNMTDYNFIVAKIEFDNLVYNPFVRKQQFDMIDFLSYFGGLLGLFAGISVISTFEVIFRIAIRLCRCKLSRSITRVRPFIEELPVYRRKINKFEYCLRNFLKESSINGLNFISSGNVVQSVVWILIIAISGSGCLFMVFETGQKIPNSQIVAYDDNMKSFGYIDFPAVTFITTPFRNNNATRKIIDLKESLKILHEQGIKIPEEKLKDLASLHIQNCNSPPPILFQNSNRSYNILKYSLHALQNASRLGWFRQQSFLVNGRFQPIFAEVLTYRGLSYSFNLLDADELFDLEMNIPDSYYVKNVTSINIENGTKFVKNIKVGKGSNTEFSMKLKKEPNKRPCNANRFIVHDNDESPRLMEFSRWPFVYYGFEIDIEAVPVVIRTDKTLQKLSPNDRECYFDGEKKLKYYKKYSMTNCVAECFSKYMLNQCGCIDRLFYPASADEYCDFDTTNPLSLDCLIESRKNFYKLDISSSLNCSCLPTCDSVTYHIQYSHKYSAESDELSINLRVNTEDAILFRRYQQFTFSDVVSYVGGLLGLFAGISMLSIVEIVYFFIIRVGVDGWRAIRGQQ